MYLEDQLKELKTGLNTVLSSIKEINQLPSYLHNVNISVTEFAKVAEMHPETVKRQIKASKIKAHKEGKNFAIPLNELIKIKGL